MPPKTKASARKTENKTTNGTAQKRSVRGGNQTAEIKKNAKAQESKPIKKGKAVKEVVEEEQTVKESDEENEELMTEEQEEALRKEILGDMASDDEESDDEEKEDDQAISGDAFNSAEDVISLDPEQVKKSKEETKAKFDKKKKAPVTTEKEDERGVIYLGRIPHGFYEDEMKGYFSQFGTVSQLRLARNKRGQPKHYGFIEFESAQVADIVADTMNNYLLLGHILQCKVLPKESIHPNLFKGTSKRFRKVNPSIIQQKKHNQTRSEEKQKKRIIDLLKAENERRKKIKELGIDYEFPGYTAEYEKYKETKSKETKLESEAVDDKKNKTGKAAPKATKTEKTEEKPNANKRKRNQKAEPVAEVQKKEVTEAATPAAKKAKRTSKPRAAKK